MQGDNEQGVENLPIRRSRKDQQGRDYICGCGKRYLSYPALYTHIKTKHNGIQPEGTQKTSINLSRRTKPKIDEEMLKSMLKLLQKKDLSILNEFADAQGSVPPIQRIRAKILPQKIYSYFNNYMIKIESLKLSKSSPVDLILITFLMNVGQFICEELYVYFLYFVKIIRNCFYQHGDEVFQTVFKDKIHQLQPFNFQQCKYLPVISDFMIRHYAPVDYPQIDINILQFIVFDFCKWMNKLKLTDICINLKKNRKNEQNSLRNIPKVPIQNENHTNKIEQNSDQDNQIEEDPQSNQYNSRKNQEDQKNQKESPNLSIPAIIKLNSKEN